MYILFTLCYLQQAIYVMLQKKYIFMRDSKCYCNMKDQTSYLFCIRSYQCLLLVSFILTLCYTNGDCVSYASFTVAPWAALPVSVTMWSYCFGALSMALASIYYCTQPEVFSLPLEVSCLVFLCLVCILEIY